MNKNRVWVLYTDEEEFIFTDEELAHAWFDYYSEQLEQGVDLEEKKIYWNKPPYPYWDQVLGA